MLRAIVIIIIIIALLYVIMTIFSKQDTPQADRFFSEAEPAVYEIAQKIERNKSFTADAARSIPDINKRYFQDMTLLFFAISVANLEAVDTLLAAGADTRQTDRVEGSSRDFIYYLGSPGGSLIDQEGVNTMIRSYLRHGGDPNVLTQGQTQRTLLEEVALVQNQEGFLILLEAGADPWAVDFYEEKQRGGAMETLAFEPNNHTFIHKLIDNGYFDDVPQERLEEFFSALGNYAQRGDERSLQIKAIAMRVLKRNQGYDNSVEHSSQGTKRIFVDHWEDETIGEIPWEVIRSDEVK